MIISLIISHLRFIIPNETIAKFPHFRLDFVTHNRTKTKGIMLAYLAMQGSRRMEENLKYIRDELENGISIPCNYFAINYTISNETHSLTPPLNYQQAVSLGDKRYYGDRDLSAKFFFAINYFLKETTFDWLWRGTDDTLINFGKLSAFVEDLHAKYDPVREPIVLGMCVGRNWNEEEMKKMPFFIQGGSGVVISRRAAEILAPHLIWTMHRTNHADDVIFTWLLNHTGILMNPTSAFFLGHSIKPHMFASLRRAASSLPECPPLAEVERTKCRSYVGSFSDIVFFHEQHTTKFGLGTAMSHAKTLWGLNHEYGFHLVDHTPKSCRRIDEGAAKPMNALMEGSDTPEYVTL